MLGMVKAIGEWTSMPVTSSRFGKSGLQANKVELRDTVATFRTVRLNQDS